MKKLSLVLGGGAAKGFAHIGVIKVLKEYGIEPNLIVGTSMGAIIGGAYASGLKPEEMEEFASKITNNKVIDFNLFSMIKNGYVLNGKKLEKLIHNLLGDVKHEDLKTPFVAVATELSSGKQINLKKGLVYKNVLASSAIPAVFPSVEIDGKILSDGGLKDNLPANIARKIKPEGIILSIDVIGDYEKQIEREGMKIVNQILNMGTLLMTQNIKIQKDLSDLYVKITQPKINQMNFSTEAVIDSITNGEKAMRKNINQLIALLEN